MTFAADYRRIMGPRLQAMARFQGLLVAVGEVSFGDAHARVLAEAYRLGAARLSPWLRAELDDAVALWLLAAIDAVLPAWEAAQRLADRVGRDITHWEGDRHGR